jgi:TatD DNase family protein
MLMNAPELIDTHAHLYLEDFAADLETVMERARREGVTRIYLPALDSHHAASMFSLEEKYPGICLAMAGIHPCYVKEDYGAELDFLRNLLTNRKFAAIGEIGLDYYWSTAFSREQKTTFEQQMEMAFEYGLPVVIHSRNAMDDTIEMLRAARGTGLKGIFHCFSGTLQNALDVIDCGMLLGIGGVVTYKNAGLAEVIAELPLEHLVLETDAPYLTPVPFRGKRNESSYLKYIVSRVAEVKGISEAEVALRTTANARKLFAL